MVKRQKLKESLVKIIESADQVLDMKNRNMLNLDSNTHLDIVCSEIPRMIRRYLAFFTFREAKFIILGTRTQIVLPPRSAQQEALRILLLRKSLTESSNHDILNLENTSWKKIANESIHELTVQLKNLIWMQIKTVREEDLKDFIDQAKGKVCEDLWKFAEGGVDSYKPYADSLINVSELSKHSNL
jgi:hypothetical protein